MGAAGEVPPGWQAERGSGPPSPLLLERPNCQSVSCNRIPCIYFSEKEQRVLSECEEASSP